MEKRDESSPFFRARPGDWTEIETATLTQLMQLQGLLAGIIGPEVDRRPPPLEVALRLGIDSYSLRSQGWDAFQLLEYSADLKLDNVHFSERRNFASLDSDYLRRLRARADELGLAIEVGMGSFDRHAESFRAELGSGEEQLGQMVDAAVICGSPVVRCFLGTQTDRLGERPFRQHLEECVRTLKAVGP